MIKIIKRRLNNLKFALTLRQSIGNSIKAI